MIELIQKIGIVECVTGYIQSNSAKILNGERCSLKEFEGENLFKPNQGGWSYSAFEKPTIEQLHAIALLKEKEAQAKKLFDQLNFDVYLEMAQVFKTKNAESATAYLQTWKEMMDAPSEFAVAGIYDELGNALNTSAKVQAYAQAKISAARAYAIWRVKRIQQFYADRAALGA
jgi:hypothetical protein